MTTPIQSTIPLSDIDLGDRARKDYKDLKELASSINEHGLIHPIAISKHPDPEAGKPYLLVAGGRRFRAHEAAGHPQILCRIYDHVLSNLELRSIELEENIQREDLSWQEKVQLEREIHNLQLAIHGPKVSKSPTAPGHSMTDTANLLGIDKGKLSKDFSLAETMEQFPDAPWDKCKTVSDAQKLRKRMESVITNDALAEQAQKAYGDDNAKRQKLYEAYTIRDFFEGVAEYPAETFDFVELDPPYGIDLQVAKSKRGLGANGLDVYNEIDAKEYPDFLAKTFKACYKALKNDSYLVCWFGPDPWFELIASLLEGVGFRVPRIPGIWAKPNGQTNSPTTRLGSAYEMFFYAAKGNPQIAKPGRSNIFQFSPVSPDRKRHPTQRPEEMIIELLQTFAKPNSKVLVPFAGSGATLTSAVLANMHPVGFDLAKPYRDAYVLDVKERF